MSLGFEDRRDHVAASLNAYLLASLLLLAYPKLTRLTKLSMLMQRCVETSWWKDEEASLLVRPPPIQPVHEPFDLLRARLSCQRAPAELKLLSASLYRSPTPHQTPPEPPILPSTRCNKQPSLLLPP